MQETTRDIYETLGIRRDASAALAREMYWARVGRYLEAERRGESDARHAIDELNAALAIVLDQTLRAEYDAQHESPEPIHVDPTPRSVRERRAALAVLVAVAAVIVAALLYFIVGPVPSAVALVVGALSLTASLLMLKRDEHTRATAFAALHLPETATQEEIDVAYRSRVQELLLRLRFDRGVIPQLEILDRAYFRATAAAIERDRDAGEPSATPTRLGMLGHAVKHQSLVLARALARQAGAGVVALSRLVGREAGRAAEEGQRAAREAPAQLGRMRAGRDGEPDVARAGPEAGAETMPTVDVARRLELGFKAASTAIASTITQDDVGVPETERPSAFLLLEAAAGVRRVPVGDVPIRIGRASHCDLVLQGDDVAPEHALLWQRGSTLLLHVVAPDHACTVNGRPVTWAHVEDGDVLEVGGVEMRIEERDRVA